MLIQGLPRESALGRELGGEKADWTLEAQLLAAVFDVARQHVWWAVEIARDEKKGRNPYGDRPPAPLPRPGVGETPAEPPATPSPRLSAARLDAADRERAWRESWAGES